MFEPFSRGYYVGRLYVEPHGGDRAVIQRTQHERVNEQLYASGEGVERLDNPLVMKVCGSHFAVHGDDRVPESTLYLPESRLEEAGGLPDLKEILLAKADHASRLLDIYTEPAGK
ncbi:DUF5802 family protein [Natronorarus salvus]|uniref:DUF5802 family protein n=1 Tax=Natronorarus salvus TaxID=3117733 RepID=UPI002F266BBE